MKNKIFLIFLNILLVQSMKLSGDVKSQEMKRKGTNIYGENCSVFTLTEDLNLPQINSKVENELNVDVRALFSGGKKVKILPINLHEKFPNLKWINLDHAGLEKIRKIDIENIKNLVIIELMRNEIQELDENLFSANQNLELIDLSRNKIKFIDISAFDGLQNLKTLKINNNDCVNFDVHDGKFRDLINFASTHCVNEIKEIQKKIQFFEKFNEKNVEIFQTLNSQDFPQNALNNFHILLIIGVIQIIFVLNLLIIVIFVLKFIKNQPKNDSNEKPKFIATNEQENLGFGLNCDDLSIYDVVKEISNRRSEIFEHYEEIALALNKK